jgi:hypothetical protein
MVHHVRRLSLLEDQMCSFLTSGYSGSNSPDRADAAIWASSDLCLEADNFANAMETMPLLYDHRQPVPTGDLLIDGGVWAPKKDDGARVKLRSPNGAGTGHGGRTGRRYQTDGDGIVEMAPEDAAR